MSTTARGKRDQTADLLDQFRAGGMTSTFLTSPLDVVKTRLQSDFYKQQLAAKKVYTGGLIRQGARHFQETFQILALAPPPRPKIEALRLIHQLACRNVHKVEGWQALFKGLGPNLSGVVPARYIPTIPTKANELTIILHRAINFATYGNGKRIIANTFNNGVETTWVHLSAATIAGIVTGTATNPIWLIKTRLQLDKQHAGHDGIKRQYKNSFDCATQVVRQEGFRGLYRGLSASYLGVSESTLQWVLYEKMKAYLARRKELLVTSGRRETVWDGFVDWSGKIGAAGSAKLFAAIVTYPHEVVRTRLRQRPDNGQAKYTGLVQCFKTIWKEEGLVSMYGGLSPHLVGFSLYINSPNYY